MSPSPHEQLAALICRCGAQGVLKKAVITGLPDATTVRVTVTSVRLRAGAYLQLETLHADNKATHRNLPQGEAATEQELLALLAVARRAVLLTTLGDCELLRAKRGKTTLLRAEALTRRLQEQSLTDNAPPEAATQAGNDRRKARILDGSEPFLQALDVSDARGRVYDKKQAKFRQINRFLELLRDVESRLPATGELTVLDLCCGKSYLSFAVYHYLTVVLQRRVCMVGVDLKADVVEHCNAVAASLGYAGLRFVCGDVAQFVPPREQVDLVVSLHACDTATDLVLEQAIRHGARLILSTPCCHHELNHTLCCPALEMIARHSMLRQKLCDAATDALRLLLLEAYGYRTEALELIDPEQTPKNVMLRAVRKAGGEVALCNPAAAAQYEAAVRFFLHEDAAAQERLLQRLYAPTATTT